MNISENSRIWIYQSDRILSSEEEQQIQQKLDDFTSQWQAHGHQLAAHGEIRYNQFIILSVDEAVAGATGCSIDKSVYLMKELEREFGIGLFDRFRIAYRDGERVINCSKTEFEELLGNGELNSDTIVFNNMISMRRELETSWEVPMRDSWHGQVFGDKVL
ncbi:MAG: ABC transporter ATPase [Daejeonella sp.]|uniref:ABC transporter ATPase n=1 Tax=Daejeonella sp. TaxID=2805397 RepID=UPI003C744B07